MPGEGKPKKREQLDALVAWARERGFDPKGHARDTVEQVGDLIKFVGDQGTPVQSLEQVIAWARTLGFREGDDLGATLDRYRTLAAGIRAEAATETAIADEAAVAARVAIAMDFSALSQLDLWLELLRSKDAEQQKDAVSVLARLATPAPLKSLPPAVASAIQQGAARLKLAANGAPPPETVASLAAAAKSGKLPIGAVARLALREAFRPIFDEIDVVGQFIPLALGLSDDIFRELERARDALARAPTGARKADREIAVEPYAAAAFDLTPVRDAAGRLKARPPTSLQLTNKEQLRNHVRDLEAKVGRLRAERERATQHLGSLFDKHRATLTRVGALSGQIVTGDPA